MVTCHRTIRLEVAKALQIHSAGRSQKKGGENNRACREFPVSGKLLWRQKARVNFNLAAGLLALRCSRDGTLSLYNNAGGRRSNCTP